MDKRIVIIGAGPTGLGAAYRLSELGYKNYEVYDSSKQLGGLASSFTDSSGFTWDIGGHVMFSHYEYYDKVFDRLMGSDYQENRRECWIRMLDTWIPYPFQNNIRYLPRELAYECIDGLIDAQTTRDFRTASNFQEFVDAVFGPGIAKHFMNPYNFKVWAHPLDMMNKEWIGERVAVVNIHRALRNLLLDLDDFGWGPNNTFKYPLVGGTGEFYRRFAPHLSGRVNLGTTVVEIDSDRKMVRLDDGTTAPYDILISTVPLDILCHRMLRQVDEQIEEESGRLLHSGGFMVGIGLKKPCPASKSWMYFPESNCPFYRVTYLSNYSPNMTPDAESHYSLLCEISYSDYKAVNRAAVVEDTISGLVASGLITEADRDAIVDTWCYEAAYSYPIPSIDRDRILAHVMPYLEAKDIFSRGRFGAWKYEVSNTDHSLMQGVELVDRLLLGEKETTIGIRYASTADGRQAAHDRPKPAALNPEKPGPLARPNMNGHGYVK